MNHIRMDDSARRAPGRATGWGWMLPCVAGLALAMACQIAQAQAIYRIKPLGYLGGCTSKVPTVVGLNNSDEVAGDACNVNGDPHAFKWRNDGKPMVDLGPSGIGSFSFAENRS